MTIIREAIEPSAFYQSSFKITRSFDQNFSPDNLTVTAAAYVFDDHGNLLFSRHPSRGWELPGGHRQKGESIVQAVEREVIEEASVAIKNIQPIGHIRIEYLGPKPDNYKYPYPTRFVQIVKAEVQNIMEFVPFEDSIERKFVPADDLKALNLSNPDQLLWLPYALPTQGVMR